VSKEFYFELKIEDFYFRNDLTICRPRALAMDGASVSSDVIATGWESRSRGRRGFLPRRRGSLSRLLELLGPPTIS